MTQPTDTLIEKLTSILTIVKSIEEENAEIADVLLQGFQMSFRLIQQLSDKSDKTEINMDEQIDMVTRVLGFPIEDLVTHIVTQKFPAGEMSMQNPSFDENSKEADSETLDFITSDLDDYERFLAQSKAKDSLNFLKDQI